MVQGDEEVKTKFKEDIMPMAQDCIKEHTLTEGKWLSAQNIHLLIMRDMNTKFWLGGIVKTGQLGDDNEGGDMSQTDWMSPPQRMG